MSVLVVGSIALDTIETPHKTVEDSVGGSALYFSSAASFFAPVKMVGVVGSDFNFDSIAFLKDRGVDTEGLYVEEGKTFRWGGRYLDDINKRDTLFTHLNVFENFEPRIPDAYRDCEYVFLANIAPALQLQVLDQIRKPKLVVLDTMNFWINGQRDILDQVIKRCDVVILNDEEVKDLSDESNLIVAGKKILSNNGPKYLIIKKGEHGAVLMSGETYFSSPAFPLEIVLDPTGAGDSFAGGFLGYIASVNKFDADTMRKAIIYGNTVASFSVQDFSFNKLKNANRDMLDERFETFKEIVRF